MIRFSLKLVFILLSTIHVHAKTGKYYGGKIGFKTEESKTHPGFLEVSLKGTDSISTTTLARLQFLHIGFTCKEKHFHAMLENTPKDHETFQVIRCKADDASEDADKKAAVISHGKELTEYCADKHASADEDSWIKDIEIKKLCDKYLSEKK